MNPSPSILHHPEHIHPSLWKGTQLAQAQRPALSTGFSRLDAELPGRGWPIGALVEISLERPGIGEISLLRPALAQLGRERSIMLIQPPCAPHFRCWANWGLHDQRLLWVQTDNLRDTLWACDKALRHNACSALLCWAPGAQAQSLRRLHLAAQQSDTLLVMLRSPAEARQPCAAPLRLGLRPAAQGLLVSILKRRGPACEHAIPIILHPERAYSSSGAHHVSLDQPSSAPPQPGRRFSSLAH